MKIRVVFSGQLFKSRLYLFFGGIPANAEHFIVVSELHNFLPYRPKSLLFDNLNPRRSQKLTFEKVALLQLQTDST